MTTSAHEHRHLPLSALVPGSNPRTDFDGKSLAELAASIQAQGILLPLLVRPLPTPVGTGSTPVPESTFEIICGERRFRAAQIAGLTTVPCLLRPCTDLEAEELRLIENLQREGVHRLDEAARMRQLIESGQHTVESLAARLGKSTNYVYACLKLERLPRPLQERCRTGELNDSVALLLARIPDPAQQLRAAGLVAPPGGTPLSYAAARELVSTRFMRRLKGAPFALKTDPSCLTCPHRTGNQAALYPDASADVCTYPPCYQKKARSTAKSSSPSASPSPLPATTPSLPHSTPASPSAKLLDRAKTLAAECVADAARPMRATLWLRWLAEHSAGAPSEADWSLLGVPPGRPRSDYLAAQTVSGLTALLVRAALHPDRLVATSPLHPPITPSLHPSHTPSASPWHPRFLQALQIASLQPPKL